jgi:hypothetical protein
MKNAEMNDGKRMTVKEVAGITGAAARTVAAYAQKAGWTQNGVQTLLDENQITLIAEAMKARETGGAFHKKENGGTLHNLMQGFNTSKSRAIRMAVLAKKQQDLALAMQAELEAEIAELKTENKALKGSLSSTQRLLDSRTAGLEMIQRIAEAAGLVKTDREDVLDTYRRKL